MMSRERLKKIVLFRERAYFGLRPVKDKGGFLNLSRPCRYMAVPQRGRPYGRKEPASSGRLTRLACVPVLSVLPLAKAGWE